jgi:hypothetical protein
MRGIIIPKLLFLLLIISYTSGYSQEPGSVLKSDQYPVDSVKPGIIILDSVRNHPEISLSFNQAVEFLRKKCQPYSWKETDDPLRSALERLIYEASNPRYDSVEYFLKNYHYDSISIPWERFYTWKPLIIKKGYHKPDSVKMEVSGDSVLNDTINVRPLLNSKYGISGSGDTIVMVVADTLPFVTSSSPALPFRYYTNPWEGDSIRAAAGVLMDFLETRDSSILNITGIRGGKTPIWLNSGSDRATRYWLNNDLNDSVTIWISNPEHNTLGLYLENGVSFRRPPMQRNITGASVNVEEIDKSRLLEIKKIETKSQFWKFRTESLFSLNQGSLSNWVKGGESNISGSVDITSFLDYDNKSALLSSNHFARLKYGMIMTGDKGLITNLDLLETNSKLNHKAFGKFDFSAIMLFKTQISKGYNYPNDSIPVSKFMNPAILTIGLGLDYKPDKLTSINFSPFSYKGTFIPDTATIDQTKYGIPADKRSKNEPGASLMISNIFKPVKTISVTNRLQLFTNYIHNPMNIDVDWEMILAINLNWFTDVRLNTHLIFDDDTKTLLFDKEKNPVLGPDGLQKKTARIQFKEMLGVSFAFRF